MRHKFRYCVIATKQFIARLDYSYVFTVAFLKALCYNNQALRPVGQAVKTLASHAENMGSIPVRVTNEKTSELKSSDVFGSLSIVGVKKVDKNYRMKQTGSEKQIEA